MTIGKLGFSGNLKMRHLRNDKEVTKIDQWKHKLYLNGVGYKLRNKVRPAFLKGWFNQMLLRQVSSLTHQAVFLPQLSATVIKENGDRIDLGVISYRSVTTAFCEFMVDQLIAETTVFGDFKWHDGGVGVTAENITDTDIETTDGEARVSGTQVESTSVIYESVGTIAYTTTKAITEHGLFNASTGVTLMDRSQFAAINVVNGDSIQFTYDLTCTAGG